MNRNTAPILRTVISSLPRGPQPTIPGCPGRLGLGLACPRASSHHPATFFSPVSPRTYATHRSSSNGNGNSSSAGKDQEIHSDLLGKLGQGAGGAGAAGAGAGAGQESVGPFPLGVGAGGRTKGWKSWKELGVGGKVVRTTQQTGNLTVILVGGALFVLLTVSLTTELFAKNSPSVLYSQAVDMIRASDALNAHLLPPLKFTHSPHSSAPVRGSPPIAHTYVRNPSSGRDHLLLTFWIHGRGKDEPDPSLSAWGMGWVRAIYAAVEGAGKQGLYAVGLGGSPATAEVEEEDQERLGISLAEARRIAGETREHKQKEEEEQGWLASVFGGWTSLRAGAGNVAGKISTRGLPPAGTFKIGEARAEYVKDASGHYNLLTLLVDIPSSTARRPNRAVIFQSTEASTEGMLGKRFR